MDEAIFIPLVSAWCIPDHSEAMSAMAKLKLTPEEREQVRQMLKDMGKDADLEDIEAGHAGHDHDEHDHDEHDHAGHDHSGAYHLHDDRIHLLQPEEEWKLSGVFVDTRAGNSSGLLKFYLNNQDVAMLTNPADQMRQFFGTFMRGPSLILLGMAALVTVVAAISILVSIYNSVAARRREIAIFRALGATRDRVMAIICGEAALIGLIGAVVGLVLGHVLAGFGSALTASYFGSPINYLSVSWHEALYVLCVVIIAMLAGLVPAWAAYRTPVAENLVAE
jgi:putative ABC transport system permease protein